MTIVVYNGGERRAASGSGERQVDEMIRLAEFVIADNDRPLHGAGLVPTGYLQPPFAKEGKWKSP